MGFRKHGLSINEAKGMDMVDYLSTLGHEPSKIRNADYWYLSPLRDEKTPSFKVNRKLNRWFDHGLGKGGNIIDFAIQYHDCTVGEFLQKTSGSLSFQKPVVQQPKEKPNTANKINVLQDYSLRSSTLLSYLEQRRIPIDIADQFCREIRYELNNKTYFGIGFKNNSGGYEIRNPYFKASSSPKDVTTINNGAKDVLVFEGFMDFLSFLAINKHQPEQDHDYVVLNSVSFFEKARLFLEQYEAIHLYLDRDTTGQNCSLYALSLSSKYKDESHLYQNHKDLNDWVINIGKPPKKRFRQRLE